MATNFEVYKDELSNILAQREGRCIVMEADDIIKRGFHRFCKGSDCGECWRELFKYLAEEHIEQPKLTKRERAFCEAFQTGWVAKDSSDVVCWYANPPIKGDGMWNETGVPVKTEMQIPIDFWFFDFIKWEDEKPWSIEDLLKLEVMEVQE